MNENYDFSKKIEKALEGQVNLNKPVNYVIKPLAAKEDNEKPKLFSFYSEVNFYINVRLLNQFGVVNHCNRIGPH